MGDNGKTHVRQTLAFLRAAGQRDKLVGDDGDGGDACFFKIGLINYQP
jgi:hypothetical protein